MKKLFHHEQIYENLIKSFDFVIFLTQILIYLKIVKRWQ